MAITSTNVTDTYAKLLTALDQFQKFLDALDFAALKKTLDQVKSFVPQIGTVVTTLITLMQELKKAIDSAAAASVIGDIDKVENFAGAVTSLLQAAEALIPAQQSLIDDVLKATTLVSGLPSVGDLKKKLDPIVDKIITDLQKLQ